MIDKKEIIEFTRQYLQEIDYFLVDLTVSKDNDIVVEIDALNGNVDIEKCIALNNAIENHFDRDIEDYSLEVGSAGITSPLKVAQQFIKNIGAKVEVLTTDGRKLSGTLKSYENGDISIEVMQKVRVAEKKRPELQPTIIPLKSDEIKYVKPEIEF